MDIEHPELAHPLLFVLFVLLCMNGPTWGSGHRVPKRDPHPGYPPIVVAEMAARARRARKGPRRDLGMWVK